MRGTLHIIKNSANSFVCHALANAFIDDDSNDDAPFEGVEVAATMLTQCLGLGSQMGLGLVRGDRHQPMHLTGASVGTALKK